MLLGLNDSKCTAYTVNSARGLLVIQTHLVLASGKLVLQKRSQVSPAWTVFYNKSFHTKASINPLCLNNEANNLFPSSMESPRMPGS